MNIKKIPTWLKVFAALYIISAIANSFAITQFIGGWIGVIMGLWIIGYIVLKLGGSASTGTSCTASTRGNPSPWYNNDDACKQAEHERALKVAQENAERADAAYKAAEHEAWLAEQEQKRQENGWG